MTASKVKTSDLFGIFFVQKPGWKSWDSYYKTIDALRPLFANEGFKKVVSGYYLNICGDFDSVRISYFMDKVNDQDSVSIIEDFLSQHKLLEISPRSSPHQDIIAGSYGGQSYEERFRTFLVNETQIGLELIERDLLHARRLFVTYRFQVREACLSFRMHFESAFGKYSPTYNSWAEEEKHQFFVDLEEWPNPPQVDWAHLMVNFVLGCDFAMPLRPLTIAEINGILSANNMGFQIPLDWKP